MQLELTDEAKEHLLYWRKTDNKQILQKISKLIDAIIDNPFEGIGKPEALKYGLAGKWSRRITDEHRFVYQIEDDIILVFSLKGHY